MPIKFTSFIAMPGVRLTLLVMFCSFLFNCGTAPQKDTIAAPTGATTPQETEQGLSELDKSIYLNAKLDLANGDIQKAEKQFKSLSKKYSKNPQIGINLATCDYLKGDYEKAQHTLSDIEPFAKDVAAFYNVKGLVAIETKAFTNAENAYLKAIELDKTFANAHYNLALLYDIYYQNIKKAFYHYTQYLANIDFEDKTTTEWVEQLKYSLEL